MHSVIVQKCAPDGSPVFAYRAELAERLPHGVRLAARWERPALALGYATFETGDYFTEWFFDDRWYNVMRIHSVRDGALKGWYCNVTRPAEFGDEIIQYRDLYLDVWVHADGSLLVLDEDEFAAGQLDPVTHQQALDGLAALQEEIARRRGPFAELERR